MPTTKTTAATKATTARKAAPSAKKRAAKAASKPTAKKAPARRPMTTKGAKSVQAIAAANTVKRPAPRAAKPEKLAKEPIDYAVNGKRIAPSWNKLSNVAYFYSHGLEGDQPRVGVKRFVEILQGLGVANPYAPSWVADLPNGIILEAVKPGADLTVAWTHERARALR